MLLLPDYSKTASKLAKMWIKLNELISEETRLNEELKKANERLTDAITRIQKMQ